MHTGKDGATDGLPTLVAIAAAAALEAEQVETLV